jgi:hypothetical protein
MILMLLCLLDSVHPIAYSSFFDYELIHTTWYDLKSPVQTFTTISTYGGST